MACAIANLCMSLLQRSYRVVASLWHLWQLASLLVKCLCHRNWMRSELLLLMAL